MDMYELILIIIHILTAGIAITFMVAVCLAIKHIKDMW